MICDCDPVAFRKDKTILPNITNDQIKTANKTCTEVNEKPWNQTYKNVGIQWKSVNTGTTMNDSGLLPYEAWKQNTLNPT
ncbi:hypothetical protein AA0242T_2084 [Acetobacter aceti NRIC 0242]|uniref:Uncharacterized protein n=2 Tax=Acetobacter aceti TaxID=435 RepID=A0A6S6PIM8_ACEAC|nr:hypothetical protein AAJCM20276_13100 [Acetobacter aceti]BCK75415.1 hypothetical protein EMQ_1021 [Acetobacter aceti NBRC 14818]GAN58668.1 hypothetical protein Abac_063_003 [Acetobacter aceti NBRC 14818]GBO81382.1 hypothetical protein AA0242T_2084 [Acetobacter aceti NRIC 0242]